MARIFILVLIMLIACKDPERLADPADYHVYLHKKFVATKEHAIRKEIGFWSKRLEKDTGNYLDQHRLGLSYLELFRLKGNTMHLTTGDSLLRSSAAKLDFKNPELLFSLSQASIARHEFRRAHSDIELAEKAGADPYTLSLLKFDAAMELGLYREARRLLTAVKNETDFNYLVRKSKWEDHLGRSDQAITCMEQATNVMRERDLNLYCWALSNLADMYGHAGRIEEAYKTYLLVLKMDPANLHCLKGIAWITWSNDGDPGSARSIIDFILSQKNDPELYLMLSDIAESKKDPAQKAKWLNAFLEKAEAPGTGRMYNKYLVQVHAGELNQAGKALDLAREELKNRLTPETYDGLSWALYKNGQYEQAYQVTKGSVYKYTFEPDALFHSALIFSAVGETEKAKNLLNACLESSFELGPLTTNQIREKLKELEGQ